MSKALIVIANKVETKLYLAKKESQKLNCLETIENEKGRLKESELVTDSAGEASKIGLGQRKMAKEQTAVDRVLENYSHDISEKIQKVHYENPEMKIFIVAEPGFQGILNKDLKKKKITPYKVVAKELNHLTSDNIYKTLQEEIEYACFV